MNEILIPKKNVILDATVMSSLMGCEQLTDYRYNKHLVSLGGKSNSLEAGSIVHKVLEEYYRHIINGFRRETAINDALMAGELYVRGCQYCSGFEPIHNPSLPIEHDCDSSCILTPPCKHQVNEYPGVMNTPAENMKEPNRIGWKWALETCQQYFDHYKGDYWTPLEVETVKKKILYEDDDIRVLWKAKLDLIADTYDGIFPIDHKTMKQRRDTRSLNNQFMGQCLLLGTKKVFINKIGFQLSLKPEEKFTRPPVSYTNERLNEWQSVTLPYYAYMYIQCSESGYWPMRFSNCENKYGDCPFVGICETPPNNRAEELQLHFKVGPKWDPVSSDDE